MLLPYLLTHGRDKDGKITLQSCKEAILAIPAFLAAFLWVLAVGALMIGVPLALLFGFVQPIRWMWNVSL